MRQKVTQFLLMTLTVTVLFIFVGCTKTNEEIDKENTNVEAKGVASNDKSATYQEITPEEAKVLMEEKDDVILLDVRTEEEYEEGHIPGSILIPLDVVATEVEDEIQDKDAVILVYCRTGRRSAMAAEEMVELGYSKVFDLGGIVDWPYETEVGE